MAPIAVTVRYRFSEGGEARDASFHGLFFDRSDQAVRDRLREAHRSAERVEIVELRWLERPCLEGAAKRRQGGGS